MLASRLGHEGSAIVPPSTVDLLGLAAEEAAPFEAENQVVAGNVIGYGATSGEMFLRGTVGEPEFCVTCE